MVRLLVIWGAGGHALTVADIVRLRGEYEVVGFLDDVNPGRHGSMFCRAPILGGAEQLDPLRQRGVQHLVFGFGDISARLRLAPLARAKGYELLTVIHPQATISLGAVLGAGCVIKAAAVVEPGATLGENVIVGPGAVVGHGCIVGDGARISVGAILSGNVTIGRAAWIGSGATIIDGIRIGEGSVVGAGAVVVRDIPDMVVAYGVPARVVRKVAASDV